MNTKYYLKYVPILFILCIFIFSFLSGCASVPKSTGMTADQFNIQKKHSKSVCIYVIGGGESFLIANAEFQKAIKASILQSNLFSAVIHGENTDYRLDVFLGDQKQTYFGLNMATEMEVIWNLSKVKTGKTVWQKSVKSSYTATTDDAFVGATRFRLSTERAARENIKIGIKLLSQIDL
ncbi:MAG: hypothetical protein K8S18_17285 [Desulfobacula sp.]|nr:hypothetical protein [Desulfobacula sp.]